MNRILAGFLRIVLLATLSVLLAACSSLEALSSQPKPGCDKSADPTDKDIKYALNYTGKLFHSARIMTFLLSFPEKDQAIQDQAASQLFPKLAACP